MLILEKLTAFSGNTKFHSSESIHKQGFNSTTDRVLSVGIGTSSANPKDALEIF